MPRHLFRGRLLFLGVVLAQLGSMASASAQTERRALPLEAPAPMVVPAVVNAITFKLRTDGEDHKIIVTPTPTLLRVDEPSDGFSVIYDSRTEHYTGLENRNYTYWEFSWPQVRTAVESSKRYESRLRELGTDGMSGYTPEPDPNGPLTSGVNPDTTSTLLDTNFASASGPAPTADSDNSGYVWRPTTDHKRLMGLDCVHWTGESLSGNPVDAWCSAGPLPQVQNALAQLRAINEPMALVPVREIVPPFVFEVEDALAKGGVTPILISWGDDQDKNQFEVQSIKSHEGKLSLFTVPKLYLKTTLVTMDGMMSPVKATAPAEAPPERPKTQY